MDGVAVMEYDRVDTASVSRVDRWKYRGILWVRARLYERPAGMLLQEGQLPPSLRAINSLFAGRPVSGFLPYEAYTGDGLYKTVSGGDPRRFVPTFSFALTLTSGQRLAAPAARVLQDQVLERLPPGHVLQCLTGRLPGIAQGYAALLCVTAPAGEGRAAVTALRDDLVAAVAQSGVAVALLSPDDLLAFIRMAFDPTSEGPGYDEGVLLKNQAGAAGLHLSADRLQLRSADGVFRELALFNGRRYGSGRSIPLATLFPALLNGGPHWVGVIVQRRPEGLVGNFLAAEFLAPGAPATLASTFQAGGWLIEQDRYHAHMTFLGLLPMGINPGLADILLRQRRWRPFPVEQLAPLLPLPYQANVRPAAAAAGALLPLPEAAHA